MTKELYTIGETAKLLGVSTQTLRFYDKKKILSPVYIDSNTGYRYYSYKQFNIIDRIKYLQSFGLSLDEIAVIIKEGTVDGLIPFLYKQKNNLFDEIQSAKEKIKDIEWYINYFSYLKNNDSGMFIYRIHQEKRYILQVPVYENDELSDMEIRLAALKAKIEYSKLKYRRLYGYKVEFDGLINKRFEPYTYFIYMNQKPEFCSGNIDVLPEGEYICFRTLILKEEWKTDILEKYFAGMNKPKLAVALEFEDNLVDWSDAVYEVQMLI